MDTPPEAPEDLLARADALRDARDWGAAEAAYRAYLALRPLHWQIHVQLGHAVKEQGDPVAALDHYARAAALAPQDPDPLLQEGHTLRLLGRGRLAAERMAAALALAPEDALLRREAALTRHRLLDAPQEPPAPLPLPPPGPPTQLAFDVTDLLDYIRDARTPTGIQRVQAGVLGALLDLPGLGAPLLLVAYDPSAWRWWHVSTERFRRVLDLARLGAAEDDPPWRDAVRAVVAPDARPDAPLVDGAVLVNLGNAWGIEDYWRGLRLLRRRVALRYVAFVHDCVPLAMPEHCLELTTQLYARWFSALALHADGMFCNSRATAGEFAGFAAPLGLRARPTPLPFAAEPPPRAGQALAAADALGLVQPDERFVLFVATLESRKNHLLVFQAWLELVRRLGPARVPKLLCIGRAGWRAEAALALRERSPELRRKVVMAAGVSDLALAGLTQRCLFGVYNSFHEGWGLPVTESLAAGKPCVVPAHSGLVEAGAPGAVFFPPGDLPALVATLERLVTDPDHLAAAAARIDLGAVPRSWRDAAEVVATTLAAPPAEAPARPAFPLGARLSLGLAAPPPDLGAAWGEAVREGLGWWWQDGFGCWTRDGVATLLLPAGVPAGTPMRVLLELRGPPGGLALRLRLRGARPLPWQRLRLAEGEDATCVLLGEAGGAGLAVDLDSGDGVALGDRAKRRVGVGVRAVMACREDDLPARLAALERAAG